MTPEALKIQQRDYFVAEWEERQLAMTPYCFCGRQVNEDYFCDACGRQCTCQVILCRGPQTLRVVEMFLHGNPDFKNFQAFPYED
ncbi:MAG: hypothetical protein WHS86_03825 [Desulfosoma sp.]